LKDETTAAGFKKVSRPELIDLLNQDLSREYQAMIGYVVYSQVLKGAEFMNIAGELEKHAAEELSHAPDHRRSGSISDVFHALHKRPNGHPNERPLQL
jgi:rubrerythrin